MHMYVYIKSGRKVTVNELKHCGKIYWEKKKERKKERKKNKKASLTKKKEIPSTFTCVSFILLHYTKHTNTKYTQFRLHSFVIISKKKGELKEKNNQQKCGRCSEQPEKNNFFFFIFSKRFFLYVLRFLLLSFGFSNTLNLIYTVYGSEKFLEFHQENVLKEDGMRRKKKCRSYCYSSFVSFLSLQQYLLLDVLEV
jgi:hypothetical protein